jgi:hypothetical protein
MLTVHNLHIPVIYRFNWLIIEHDTAICIQKEVSNRPEISHCHI